MRLSGHSLRFNSFFSTFLTRYYPTRHLSNILSPPSDPASKWHSPIKHLIPNLYHIPIPIFNTVALASKVPGAPDGLRADEALSTSEQFAAASTYAGSIDKHLALNGKIVRNPPFQPLKELAHDIIHQAWKGNVVKDASVALQ